MSTSLLPSPLTAHVLAELLAGQPWNGTVPAQVDPLWRGPALRLAQTANDRATRREAFRQEITYAGLTDEEQLEVLEAIGAEGSGGEAPEAGTTPRFAPEPASALLARDYPPLLEVVPNLLYEGTTLLCAPPKAGKTVIMYHVAIAVGWGGAVFGSTPVGRAGVLYLALEDGPRRVQRRLRKLLAGKAPPDNLHLLYRTDTLATGLLEQIDGYLEHHPDVRLVVIDTLASIRGKKQQPTIGMYQQDYDELAPLTAMAQRRRISLVIVHHTRKLKSDDPMDMVNATQGAGGAVDAVIILQRSRKADDPTATMAVMGRDFDEDHVYHLKYESMLGTYALITEQQANEARATTDRKAILLALQQAGHPLTAQEVAAAIGKDYDTARQMLFKMADSGLLQKPERGQYAIA